MSVSIYDGTNDALNKIAGREDTSFWEGTQAQWDALSSSEKAEWTGKYVIITDDEDSEVVLNYTTTQTYATIFNLLYSLIDFDKLKKDTVLILIRQSVIRQSDIFHIERVGSDNIAFAQVRQTDAELYIDGIRITTDSSVYRRITISTNGSITNTNLSSNNPSTSGKLIVQY